MEFNWKTILNVLIALLIFKVLDGLFLDNAITSITNKIKGEG